MAPLSPRILETYRKLDAERLELATARKLALRSKVRRLLLAAAAFSVITHVLLLLYRYQIARTEVPPESISFRLALDASEEVALSPGPDFEDLLPGLDALDLESSDPAPAFTSAVPSAPIPVGGAATPSLGGAGWCWGGLGLWQRFRLGWWRARPSSVWLRRMSICLHRDVRFNVHWLECAATGSRRESRRGTPDTRAVAELLKSIAKLPTVAFSSVPLRLKSSSSLERGLGPCRKSGSFSGPELGEPHHSGRWGQPVDAIQSAVAAAAARCHFPLTDGEFPVEPALLVLQP